MNERETAMKIAKSATAPIALAALLALAALGDALSHPARSDDEAAFWGGLRGGSHHAVHASRSSMRTVSREEPSFDLPKPKEQRQKRADRPVHIPRGSSTYIPPPVPSPNSPNSPPAQAFTQPTVQPYNPPHITTFSDRATDAIHDYPLQKGLGNNPLNQQEFIRQRLNQ